MLYSLHSTLVLSFCIDTFLSNRLHWEYYMSILENCIEAIVSFATAIFVYGEMS